MKISKNITRKKFAALVVKQLEKHDISCVLVGGACVSIYTDERHASRDLDFISAHSHESITLSLKEIGFEREGRYFKHADCEFYVEFPTGPVGIGNQSPIKAEGRLKVNNTIITLYSPTQSIMDRLAAYFHWNDKRSLIHALWICEKHPVKMTKIKRWAEKENAAEKFEIFLQEYKKLKASKSQKD